MLIPMYYIDFSGYKVDHVSKYEKGSVYDNSYVMWPNKEK